MVSGACKIAQIVPDDVLFADVIDAAIQARMHIISNGHRIVISPVVPKGWTKIGVKVIDRHRARLEVQPCAA